MPTRVGFHLFSGVRSAVVAACVLAVCIRPAGAQGRTEAVETADGWSIRFSYFPAPEKSGSAKVDLTQAPVVILLHGKESDRSFWDKRSAAPGASAKPFSEVLQSQGFAVVSVDLRKHGESQREGATDRVLPTDYELMVADLFAVKEFILKEHQDQKLNMRKLAIIALDDAVPVAATFAERDWAMPPYDDHALPAQKTPRGQDVRALVLLSPSTSAGRVQAANSLRYVGNPAFGVAFLIGAGKKDAPGIKNARTLHKMVSGKGHEENSILEEFDTAEKSQHLFGNVRIKAELPIIQFLKKHVQEPKIDWQDRRSRTER